MTYLVGDIGGTNTRLALADHTGVRHDTQRHFDNAGFSRFEDVLDLYLPERGTQSIAGVCLAIAGPVGATRASLTNRDWVFESAKLQCKLGTDRVLLVNDLSALSHALPSLEMTHLGGPGAAASATQSLVVGIGTGFNVSLSKRTNGGKTIAFEAELGHAALPITVWEALRDMLGPQVADFTRVEDWLCGSGLERMFHGVSGKKLSSREIMTRFGAQSDPDAETSALLFARVLGLLSRQLIYQYMPRAGLVFAGSVARSILTQASFDTFLHTYLTGAVRVADLSEIPISLIEDDAAALQGCLRVLLDQHST
ncbi:ROK family protein [Shimia thalassica]|uniref:glucokinase n=1 Tax=Shimia thalassica TaxID=1715693 RepID=UPI0026E16EB7|nr:ROK family protein [Shimia thalassica]MDO6482340.1 ROK family protein [Shimia thalassica]